MPGYETWLAWAETDVIGAEGLLSLGRTVSSVITHPKRPRCI